jgi:hypothetical protein
VFCYEFAYIYFGILAMAATVFSSSKPMMVMPRVARL